MAHASQAAPLPSLPSLTPFLHHFGALVSSPACPPSLFIHDPKQSPVLLQAIAQTLQAVTPNPSSSEAPTVEQLLPKVALLDLADVHSVKAAFDRVLDQLSGWNMTGEAGWEDRNSGIATWDGSMDGVKVVRRAKKRKTAASHAGPRRKRARMDREDEDDLYADADEEGQDDENGEGDSEQEWTLEWDRSSGRGDKPTLAPLRNTVDSFQHSLSAIFANSSASQPAPQLDFSLDPAADFSQSAQPARRFIVISHGELLSELAGSGATGAARETGIGLTFASTIYRLGQLTGLPITTVVVSRLPWRKARESLVGLPSPELLSFDDVGESDAVTLLAARFAASPLAQPSLSDSLSHAQLVELFKSLAFVVRNTFSKSTNDLEEHAYLCAKFWARWREVVEKSNPPIAPTDTARLSIALKSEFAAELDKLALPRQSLTAVPSTIASVAQSSEPAKTTQLHGFAGTIAALPKQPTYLAPVPPTPEKSGGSTNFFASASSSAMTTPTRSTLADDPFAAPASHANLRHQALASTASSSSLASSSAAQNGVGLLFSPATTQRNKQLATHAALSKSLPVVARYLLIAAYFAAVDPPKSDVRMFVRVDEMEGVAKKGKKARKASARKPGASPSKNSKPAALFGGKSFAYERMIAIFEAIVDDRREYAIGSVAIAGQVQTLLHLRLLTRASSESNTDKVLDGVKLKCPLAKDIVDALALSVGWKEWRERLVGEEP
ncbi:hypothetical protein JCM10207_008013 [Rhodosporidiobolus poonsookiae]